MNAERLLVHYGQVADAPYAVARLRRFILDLAVRGKLVAQDSNDEPSLELMRRAAKENWDQADLPHGWFRARIGAVLEFQYGKGLKASERFDQGPVPVFGSNGVVGFTEEPLTVRPSIIVGRKGSAGALNLCDGPSWTTDVAYFVEAPSFFNIQFLLNVLTALDLDKLGKGVKPGLSRSEAYDQIIAIPPLSEQHRIVAKLDELMGLCDRLEAARVSREMVRDGFAAASLARLDPPVSDTFQADVHFALDALPALTARPDQIKQIRQTILNLALRGKLVPQQGSDEPASDLLNRIEEKRAKLLKSGYPNPEEARTQIKKLTEQSVPGGLDALPIGWVWATLLQCSALVVDCKNKTAPYAASGIRLIRTTNVRDGRMNSNDQKFVDQKTYEIWSARCTPEPGDILITREAPMGEVCLIPAGERICLGQRMMLARLVPDTIDRNFMLYSLRDPKLMDRVQDKPIGATVQHLRVGGVETLLIPVPPLAEQRRIVAKLDAMMALCDRLEASLATTAEARRRLLDALLAEAVAPFDDRELEAAE
ncbi:restriction endonuclease subunit S [Bradyrhizobium diazoefficiens]|uniref:Type I restriction endonuclease EcoAI subunit S n=1 Tax=Bradyrhizobium diazoefficiens TaxID=1355477 RepID=A0A810C2U1_9BRAD|nr:type I restriction endonuclease EcoAI subunit S [Bradyrhizobium diazoefficiens]BCF01330.1 type I restriction endonuclease EcoAI subunit S [Bradyrhizobium diazoefficiens]BCF09854.1 type I restriction endonuclease EcoAI subunit S [Bradyrhizobium diazoefficiens]BCF62364.1 type I restriction endonuclease EcoAI subunit S [Bradyrhizobium diazoefficiens]